MHIAAILNLTSIICVREGTGRRPFRGCDANWLLRSSCDAGATARAFSFSLPSTGGDEPTRINPMPPLPPRMFI
jgi:hypothetical protein